MCISSFMSVLLPKLLGQQKLSLFLTRKGKSWSRAIKKRSDTKNEAKKIKNDNFISSNGEKSNIPLDFSHFGCTNIIFFHYSILYFVCYTMYTIVKAWFHSFVTHAIFRFRTFLEACNCHFKKLFSFPILLLFCSIMNHVYELSSAPFSSEKCVCFKKNN